MIPVRATLFVTLHVLATFLLLLRIDNPVFNLILTFNPVFTLFPYSTGGITLH